VVWPAHGGERLDVAFAALAGLARRRARLLISEGRVWVNGAPVRVLSRPLHTGDILDVIERGEPLAAPAPLPARLPLLHEDTWLIAVDKPAGLASQRRREPAPGELAAIELLALQLALRDGARQQLALFHRLDRITTGVMVFPRHHQASAALAASWREGRVEKRYIAVIRGDPGGRPAVVERAIGRDHSHLAACAPTDAVTRRPPTSRASRSPVGSHWSRRGRSPVARIRSACTSRSSAVRLPGTRSTVGATTCRDRTSTRGVSRCPTRATAGAST
jgi:23S rRNA-/tRNA-specific pseudouridylate synthase